MALATAVVANLALLLHVLGRMKFPIAQPITIIGWYISSLLSIGLVSAAPSQLTLPASEQRTFAQAYYYECFAGALNFMLATLMAATAWSVYRSGISREYKLTMAQRTLMLQVITLIGYILCAAAVYTSIEGWPYLDSVYWVDVTLFTIGFGDYSPDTHLGRALLFPMAVGGILFVGLIVSSVNGVVLESSSHKISRRNVEKARQRIVSQMDENGGTVRTSPTKKQGVDENASKRDRGEQEFDLLRQVQRDAQWANTIIALTFSAGSWLFLWVIGAVVFWQAEMSTQQWTYFESLYFTYTAFTTIGYGDYSPQNNAAKPAFVLWSMLALPTLTILIGAIGNTISEGVNGLTLWLGEKLPPKTPFLRNVKNQANKKKKDEDGEFTSAKPPGFMEDGKQEQQLGDDTTGQAVQGIAGNEHPEGDENKARVGENYRGYLLIKELQKVIDHVDANPPRKYTYAEWRWFLLLLEEDVKEWSWLDPHSPIMEGTDEPRWVMQRLMKKLEKRLKRIGDEKTGCR